MAMTKRLDNGREQLIVTLDSNYTGSRGVTLAEVVETIRHHERFFEAFRL
jgi:hypothetical protein